MRRIVLFVILIATTYLKAQPFPETQVAEFSPFIREALLGIETQKHRSMALVLKNADGSVSEVLYYQKGTDGELSLTHATMDLSSHKLFYDTYGYKKYCSEYFLVKRDTSDLKCKFVESKEQGKTKVKVSNFEFFNCRSGFDSLESRTFFFDDQNRLEKVSNAKRVLYTASFPSANQVKSLSYKQRCTSCGNGNEAAVVSIDTISTLSSFSKSSVTSTAYDFSITDNNFIKFMNCDWESESTKSRTTNFHVVQDAKAEIVSVQITSTEMHDNELNLTTGVSSMLNLYYMDVESSDVESSIEELLKK